MKKRTKSILCLLFCLLALAACIAAAVWIFLLPTGPDAPAQLDPGQSVGAWAKNENGFYFNDAGEAILPAVQKGIDVSKYQGEIDWQKAKDAGIDFAILRCGIGSEWNGEGEAADYTQDDPYWRRNADACTALGIPFGTYLYSYATTEEQARSEADHVARLLGLIAPTQEGLEDHTASPYTLSLPVYYDLEDKTITGLYPDEMAALVTAFFDQLAQHGYTGAEGLYASLNWVRARFSDTAFDRWRENLWVARYASSLNYTGAYSMWQCTYQEPGAAYGVQSETVDVDFIMEELSITEAQTVKSEGAEASFTNDTYQNELWMAAPGDKATLLLDEPAVEDGGQTVFWASDDETVAKVNKKGVIEAKAEGSCTVTATLADGRKSVECVVRVGRVTVPVFATGGLRGDVSGTDAAAALKADAGDAILLDAGGSLQGTARASLTGGMDVTYTFSDAGYDLQVFDASDLAFGAERLLSDAVTAAGPALAANLLTESGEPLFARCTSWNRNRISNGRNYTVQKAGKTIGFFALCSTGNTSAGAALTAADLLETATDQVAALRAEGADAVLCVTGSDTDSTSILQDLAALGVTAVIDGSRTEHDTSGPVPVLGAKTGAGAVSGLELHFAADGTVSAEALQSYDTETVRTGTLGEKGRAALADMAEELADLTAGDEEILQNTLFTLSLPEDGDAVSFGNYVAECYLAAAVADAGNIPAEYAAYRAVALAGPVTELAEGDVTRGMLLEALPGGERVQMVLTTGAMYAELLAREDVSETWDESLKQKDVDDGPVLLITDTATLQTLSDQGYTVVRDYGDAFWLVRMALSDATGAFTQGFTMPPAETAGD